MKQEPVAWMEYIQDEEWEVWFVEPTNLPKGHTYKPLYTAPRDLMPTIVKDEQGKIVAVTLINEEHQVQEVLWEAPRELSDEEILDLCPPNHSAMMNEAYTIDFARAILKKASEK